MKKIVLVGIASILSLSVFAINKQDLTNLINTTSKKLTDSLNQKYISFKSKISKIEKDSLTGDVYILSKLTGLNLTGLKSNLQNKYDNLNREIINKKYEFISAIDEAENKFNASIITSGEYYNQLENIKISLSGYDTTYNNKINLFTEQISGYIQNYNKDLEKKLDFYKNDIDKYKKFRNKFSKIEKKYIELENNYNKLIKIVGIGEDLIKDKTDEIKAYSLNYFSGLIDSEYKKFYEKNENLSYFQSGLNLKRKVLLGFVESKISSSIEKIIKSYYPEINFNEIKETVNNLKNKNIHEILKDYNLNISFISSFEKDIDEANKKVLEKLNKLENSEDKTKIFEIIKSDIVKELKNASKIVIEDIKNTLKTYIDILKVIERQEDILMNRLYEEYNKNLTGDIKKLNFLLELINTYRQSTKLPTNIEKLNNLEKVVKDKIEEVKNKEILENLSKLEKEIDNADIINKEKLLELREKVREYKKIGKFEDKVKKLCVKVKIKLNLNKLYEAGAIKYYYKFGDLSDTVANILNKYYKKYKEMGKEEIFKNKVKKAIDKLDIIMDSLDSNKRSYYMVMIYNGFIKFNSQIDSK